MTTRIVPTTVINRPRRKSASDVDHRTETLAEFAAALSEHAGHTVPFMAHVVELAAAREQLKALKARRDLIFEQVKRRYASGVTLTSDGEFMLRMSKPVPVTIVRTVESAAVKKKYPTIWQAARVAVPRVAVSAPKDWPAPTCRLPMVPRDADNLDRCVAAYKHRAFDRLASLKQDEAVLVTRLETIADQFGWDGLPMTFVDGWSIGLRSLRFDAERLAEVAPVVFDELAVDKERGGSTRLYLAHPDDDELEDFAE